MKTDAELDPPAANVERLGQELDAALEAAKAAFAASETAYQAWVKSGGQLLNAATKRGPLYEAMVAAQEVAQKAKARRDEALSAYNKAEFDDAQARGALED